MGAGQGQRGGAHLHNLHNNYFDGLSLTANATTGRKRPKIKMKKKREKKINANGGHGQIWKRRLQHNIFNN